MTTLYAKKIKSVKADLEQINDILEEDGSVIITTDFERLSKRIGVEIIEVDSN